MYLVKLENNIVLSVIDAGTSVLTPLDSSTMLVLVAPTVGYIFDPVYRIFGAPPRKRWITKLALDNRFTMAEATGLKLAMIYPTRLTEETDAAYAARCGLPAQLQVMASRLAMATYIDLNRADTRGGIQLLEQAGLLAVGRALEILDGEIAVHEYHPDA